MPRNGSGTYTLPIGPFTPNTTILSADVNDDLDDIADALTGSVASDGQTPVIGALALFAGTLALPGLTWAVDLNTGRYRPSADAQTDVCGGVAVLEESVTGVNFPLAVTQGGAPLGMPTGVVADFMGSTAPSGWVLGFGTIGNGASSATNRANADTLALFTMLWTDYGDTLAPVSGGRGASAAADFAAAKTIGGLDWRGYAGFGRDDMGGSAAGRITTLVVPNGNTLGSVGGAQSITLARTSLPNVQLDTQLNSGTVTVTVNDNKFAAIGPPGGGGTSLLGGGNPLGITASGVLANLTGFTSFLSGGAASQVATDKLSPARIVNKIIKL